MRHALPDMYVIPIMKPISSPSSSSSSSSSSTTTLMSSIKIKRLIHTLVLSHVCRVARGLSRAKTILVEAFREHQQLTRYNKYKKKYSKDYYKKNFFGSFRMHYNWCSSRALPVPAPVLEASRHFYYDSTWGSLLSMDKGGGGGGQVMNVNAEEEPIRQLSGYLQWLEEKDEDGHGDNHTTCTHHRTNYNKSSRHDHDHDHDHDHVVHAHDHDCQHHRSAHDHHIHEIDQLADAFIAGFHEKFLLEKQESYRRFQEMLARSM